MITYAGPQTPTWLTPTAQNVEVYNTFNGDSTSISNRWYYSNSSFRTKTSRLIQTLQLEPFKISNLHVLQMVALRWEEWFINYQNHGGYVKRHILEIQI